MSYIDDCDYLDAFPQAAPATVQLDPDEQDRRSALIRRMRFDLAQRAELKPKASPAARRLVALVREAADLLEGERT